MNPSPGGRRNRLVREIHDPFTLIQRLRSLFPEASGRSLKQWLAAGRVRVNGAVARDGRLTLAPDDVVALADPEARAPSPVPLRLVHEDESIVVVDKPPGLLTIGTERERERTAYRLLWDYLAARRPPARPFIVHRLDRETSGLLVFATSLSAKRRLQAQFEARSVERIYVALVEGRVREDRGRLEGRLVEDRSLRVRLTRSAGTGGEGSGREAITDYRVLERRADATLLEISLGTGRRHQIRVQLAALGHPIVGDRARGSRRGEGKRLWLHATRLGFTHPVTGAAVRFESPPPRGFGRAGSGV